MYYQNILIGSGHIVALTGNINIIYVQPAVLHVLLQLDFYYSVPIYHSAMQTEENNGTYINWLYDLYSPASMGSSILNSGRLVL